MRNLLALAITASACLWLGMSADGALALDLSGRWDSSTFPAGLQFARVTHTFEADRAVMTLDVQPSLPFQTHSLRLVRYGRYRIVGPSAQLPGAFDVDIQVERITVRMRDPDSVWLANRDNSDFCALRDWQVGVERDVSGRFCEGRQMAEAGDVEKIVARIDGASLKLSPFWGTGAVEPAARNTAVRATTLDDTHVFKRTTELRP